MGNKKTAPQDDRQLCRIAKTNRFSSATQPFQKWSCALEREVSIATIFRRLREMSFRCRKSATKPLLNHKQKLKRLQWANMHKDAQKRSKTWSKRSMKFPTSVMVWCCASTSGMGNIVFLKSTVTADVYMEVLESQLLSSIEDLYGICMAMKT